MSTTQPTQQQNQARSKGHHRNSNKAKNNTMYVKKTEEKNEQMLEDQWDIPNPNLVVIAPPPPPPQKQPQTPQKNEQKYQKQEAAESDIAGESTGDQDKSQQKQLANLSESTIEASDSNNTPKQRNSNLNATRGSLKQQKGRNSQQLQQQNPEEKGGNQHKNHQRNSKHSNTTYVPKASLTTNEVTQSQTLQSTKVQISTENVSQSVYVPLSSVTKEHQENNKSSQQSRRSHHVKPTFETYTPKYKNNNNNNNNNNDNSNTNNNNNNNNNQNSRGSFKQAANERYSHGPSQYASKFSQQNNNNNNLVNGENNENKDTNGNQFEDSPQKNQRGRYNNNNGKNRNPKRNQSEVRTPATMFSYGKTIYEEKKETEEQIQSRIAKEKEQQAEEKEQLKEFSKQIDKTLEFQRFHDAKTILKKENDKNLTREQIRVNRIIRENRKNHSIIKSPAGNQLAATNWDGLEDVEQSYEYLGRRTQGEQQDVSVSGFGQQDSTSKQNFPSLLDDSTSKLSKFAPSSIRPSRKGSFQSSEAGKDELTQEIEKARLEIEQESKQAQQSYNSQQQQISTHDIEIVYTEVKEIIHENEEDNYNEDEEDNEHTKKSNNQKKMNNKNESKTPQSNKNQKNQDKQIKKEKNGRGSQISTRNSQKDVYVRKDQLENDSPLEAQPQQQQQPKQQQTQPQKVVYEEKIVEQPIQYKVYYEEKQPEEQQKEQQEEYQVEQYEEEVEYGDVLNGLELEMELEVAPSQSRQGRNNQRQERDLQNANFQNNLMNLQQGNVEDDDEEDVHHHQDHRNGSTHKGQQSHEPEARISNLDEYVPYQLTAEDKEAFEREHYQEEQNEIKDLEQQEIQQQSTHIVSSVSHQAATLKSESSDEVLQQKEEDDEEENDEDAILSKPNCKSPPPTENITHNDVDAAAAKFEENAENSNQDSPLKKPSKVSQFKKHEEDNELELKVIEKLKQEHMLEESDIQSKQVEQVAIFNQQEDKTIQKVEVTAVTQTNQVSESRETSVKTSTQVENGVQQAATVSVVAAAATSAVEHVIHQEQDIIIFTGETTTTTTSSTTTTTTQATHTTKVETHSSQIQETHSTQHNVEVHSKVIESSVATTQQIRNEQSLTAQTSESSHVQSTQREGKQITEDQVQYDEEEVQYEEEIVEQEEELEIVTANQKRNRSENRERDLQALNGKQLDEELKHEQEQAQSLEPTSPKNDEKEGDNVHVSNEKHDRLSDELDKQCEYFNANSNYSSDKQNNTQTQDDTSSAKHIEMNGFLLDVQSEKNFDDFNHDLVSEYAKTEAPKRQTRFLQQFSDNLKDIGKSNAFIVNSLGSNIATTFAGFVCNKIVTSSLTKNGKLSQSQSNRSLFSSFSSYHSSIKN